MKLLDTSVCADHLLGRPEAVELLDRMLAEGEELACSELVRFELLAGTRDARAARPSTRSRPPSRGCPCRRASRASRPTSRSASAPSGASTDAADYLLAATAVVAGAELVTLDADHFPMFPELRAPY